ncbi:MAG: hypothetical protein WDN48_00245 [Pseudolabrys sp.]
MARKIIDISVPLENDVAADPPGYGPHRISHPRGHGRRRSQVFPGAEKRRPPRWRRLGLRMGEAFDALAQRISMRRITSPSTMDGGKRAITIDEVPLSGASIRA